MGGEFTPLIPYEGQLLLFSVLKANSPQLTSHLKLKLIAILLKVPKTHMIDFAMGCVSSSSN
jgi:hypothetical protein